MSTLLLAACGDDDAATTIPQVEDDDGVEMREPTPIRVVSGGSGVGQPAAPASASDAATSEMIPVDRTPTGGPLVDVDVDVEVVVDGVAELPTDDAGYVYEPVGAAALADVERLAERFDVGGTPVQLDDGTWRVGPDDGSAPSLWVGADAQQWWSYSGVWAVEECVTVDSEPVEVEIVDDAVEGVAEAAVGCERGAGTNVPDAAAAEAAARDLLERLQVVGDGFDAESFADEWGATVTLTSDTTPGRSWTFGFGDEAALDFASGPLASPDPVGPFPLIDLDLAVERLREGTFGLPVPMSFDHALEIDPVEPPDSITITIVDVEPDWWWAFDVDGAVWLLPAYRFIDADGGWHVVPAVTDEFLVQEAPPIAVDPPADPPADEPTDPPLDPDGPVIEPAPAGGLLAPMTGDMYEAWAEPVGELVGLPLDRFEGEVTAVGLGPVRVVHQDGEFLMVTEDFVVGRVNVAVETIDGAEVVVDAFVEGADELPDSSGGSSASSSGSAGGMVPIATVHEQVEFYPACGNESLEFEGDRWYQLGTAERGAIDEMFQDRYDAMIAVDREPSPVGPVINGLAPTVADPGPGDDVGTLVVWEDDVARWVSDSGALDVWLVLDAVEVPWIC